MKGEVYSVYGIRILRIAKHQSELPLDHCLSPRAKKKNAEKRCHIFGEIKSLNFTQRTNSQDVGSHLKTQMIQYITGQ